MAVPKIHINSHRGYEIKKDYDHNYYVYKGSKQLISCPSEKEAYAYIDELLSDTSSSVITRPNNTEKYCVRIEVKDYRGYLILCKDGHYREERYAGDRVRTFDTKNKAIQAFKHSTKAINNLISYDISVYKKY